MKPMSAPGSRNTTLARNTVAPNPYPPAVGACTRPVNPRNPKYKPIPTATVAMLVSRIGRRVSMLVDTKG